ncbi:MAG: preprotein translocase subunit SecE [Clostridia bacterium]|nr:preprotein translocase subunit SecE [Clostridia bacterium]
MAEKNEVKKAKKPGLFAKLKQKLKNLKSEFKKITWASKRTTFKSFGLVLVCIVVISLVLGLADKGLSELFNWLGTLV